MTGCGRGSVDGNRASSGAARKIMRLSSQIADSSHVIGQGSRFVACPDVKCGDELGLLDQADLEGEQAEERVSVGGHGSSSGGHQATGRPAHIGSHLSLNVTGDLISGTRGLVSASAMTAGRRVPCGGCALRRKTQPAPGWSGVGAGALIRPARTARTGRPVLDQEPEVWPVAPGVNPDAAGREALPARSDCRR